MYWNFVLKIILEGNILVLLVLVQKSTKLSSIKHLVTYIFLYDNSFWTDVLVREQIVSICLFLLSVQAQIMLWTRNSFGIAAEVVKLKGKYIGTWLAHELIDSIQGQGLLFWCSVGSDQSVCVCWHKEQMVALNSQVCNILCFRGQFFYSLKWELVCKEIVKNEVANNVDTTTFCFDMLLISSWNHNWNMSDARKTADCSFPGITQNSAVLSICCLCYGHLHILY